MVKNNIRIHILSLYIYIYVIYTLWVCTCRQDDRTSLRHCCVVCCWGMCEQTHTHTHGYTVCIWAQWSNRFIQIKGAFHQFWHIKRSRGTSWPVKQWDTSSEIRGFIVALNAHTPSKSHRGRVWHWFYEGITTHIFWQSLWAHIHSAALTCSYKKCQKLFCDKWKKWERSGFWEDKAMMGHMIYQMMINHLINNSAGQNWTWWFHQLVTFVTKWLWRVDWRREGSDKRYH